jgi:diguanylate cyclase (GGDEF)-like protein/putative nucleotidyltransferase with HDIG domain
VRRHDGRHNVVTRRTAISSKRPIFWRRRIVLRTGVALRTGAAATLLTLLMGAAAGSVSIVRDAREVRQASELRASYDDLRYGAALELNAVRDSAVHPRASRAAFFQAARRSTAALARLHAHAGAADMPRVNQLSTLAAGSFVGGARMYSALAGEEGLRAQALRRSLESELATLEQGAARGSADFRLRDTGRWPESRKDKFTLEAMVLVFLLGLGLTGWLLVGVVGLRRREADAHRLEVERLELEALTDNLTGLRNHRAFQEDLKREIARHNRAGAAFALLLVDMDGLKQVNDTYGHQMGDERIQAAADCLKQTVRFSDNAYRVGGDEFVVLLPGERAWGALTYAHRLHTATARGNVPVTVGIAECIGAESGDSLISRADLALYEAKRSHRKTVVYNPGLEPRPPVDDAEASRHHQKLLATALARAVDAKDAGTRNHCETVAEICALIGRELGFEPEHIQRLRLAGLLHDVGKIGIADAILQKPAKLVAEERAIMSTHTTIGHNIVSAADLEEEADWVLHHHERWDGHGYPGGLAGEEIPIESRIILVADAFEAITADRPYRAGRSAEDALDELLEHAGTQFAPQCVAALCAIFDHEPARASGTDELSERRRAREDALGMLGDVGERTGS